MPTKKNNTNCTTHGSRRGAFVCQHINKEHAVGFHIPAKGVLNAWCDKCDEIQKKPLPRKEERLLNLSLNR